MDSGSYVAPDGNGGYIVVVDGQYLDRFTNKEEAERSYNRYYEGTTSTPLNKNEWTSRGGSAYGTTTYAASSNGDIEQMKSELRVAGYQGPWDDASVRAAYARTVNGGNAGSRGGVSTVNSDLSDVFRGLAGSNQMDLDERKRQFDELYKLELRKLGLNEQQIDNQVRQFWASFAGQLLSTATSLRGPADWIKDAEYKSGGKDIFQYLQGNQTVPAFSAPTGQSKSSNITDILQALGVPSMSDINSKRLASGQDVSGWGLSDWYSQFVARNSRPPTQQEWAKGWAMQTGLPESVGMQVWQLGKNWQAQTGQLAPKDVQERWVQQLMSGGNLPTAPQAAGAASAGGIQSMAAPSAGGSMGVQATATSNAPAGITLPPGVTIVKNLEMPGYYLGSDNYIYGPNGLREPNQRYGINPPAPAREPESVGPQRPGNISDAIWNQLSPTAKQLLSSQGYLVPNPHQINPAVWDSMDPNSQSAILATAEEGLTPSGSWEKGQFLRQLNAARPKGTAPRRVTTNWGKLSSQFS